MKSLPPNRLESCRTTASLTGADGADGILHTTGVASTTVALTTRAVATCTTLIASVAAEAGVAGVGTFASVLVDLIDFSCRHNA